MKWEPTCQGDENHPPRRAAGQLAIGTHGPLIGVAIRTRAMPRDYSKYPQKCCPQIAHFHHEPATALPLQVCPEPVADGAQAMDRPSTAETVQSAGDIAVVQEMKEAAGVRIWM